MEDINKSSFKTKIGIMYYLWKHKNGKIIILFMGIGEKNFQKFVESAKHNFRGSDKVSIIDRKSNDIESKIIGYLDGRIKNLNFGTEFLNGTRFKRDIWNSVVSVPYGKTISYKKLAGKAGYRKAWRATGSALKNNPIILVVPCHRVIKENGSISGFEAGKNVKRFLLDLEKRNS